MLLRPLGMVATAVTGLVTVALTVMAADELGLLTNTSVKRGGPLVGVPT